MATKNIGTMTPVPGAATDILAGVRNQRIVLLDHQAMFNEAIATFMAANPSAKKIALGTLNVTQTALVALLAGTRNVTLTGVTGVKLGDDVMLFPVDVLPTGYSMGVPAATAAGTLVIPVTGPALAIGATYSIPCRAYALR